MARRRKRPPSIDDRYACFLLRIGKSRIHHFGVYACEAIPARRKVIEYTGEKITQRESLRRRLGPHHQYIFWLNERWAIDAHSGGSGAEFVNHRCEPNLYSWRVAGHILLMSRRKIRAGEELTLDYHFRPDARTVHCRCGAPNCRGTINLKARSGRL
jgi:SET domain-containing protein